MSEAVLRKQLVELLHAKSAHLDTQAVFHDVDPVDWSRKPDGVAHTLWQQLEHIRFTWHDLLVFSTDPAYTAPAWPRDYWPGSEAPSSPDDPNKSLAAFAKLQEEMIALVENPATDLYAKIPWGDGQTILREVLLAADHTSYHAGQAMALRKQLEAIRS